MGDEALADLLTVMFDEDDAGNRKITGDAI